MRQEKTKQKCWPHIMLLTYMMLVTHEPLWLIRSERRAGEPRAWARQDAAAIKEEDEDNGDDSDDSDDGDGRRRGRGGLGPSPGGDGDGRRRGGGGGSGLCDDDGRR